MASNNTSLLDPRFTFPDVNGMEQQRNQELEGQTEIDYSERAQSIRAAVLGASDGLVSTASLMMGVGAVKQDVEAMILIGFSGLVGGANPPRAAAASALAFTIGAMVPLLAAAFVTSYEVRIKVVIAAVSVTLAGFGWAGAALGNAPPIMPSARVLLGGWVAMALTFGLTKMVGSSGHLISIVLPWRTLISAILSPSLHSSS